MNITFIKALIALVPVCLLFSGSIVLFVRRKHAACFLQILGAGGLLIVIFAHICEALQLLPGMRWGLEHSPGHYLDLFSAIMGFTLYPLGYFWMSLLAPGGSR